MSSLIEYLMDTFTDQSVMLWSDGITSYNITINDPKRTVLALWTDSTSEVLID